MYELGGASEPTEVIKVKEIEDCTVRRGVGWKHTLRVLLDTGDVANDGVDTETISVKIVNGLDIARGEGPSLIGEDHTATLEVDGAEFSIEITAGVGSKEITTTKDADSVIEVQATGLKGVPAESSETKEIEVTQA